jgi:hypothetical protein
MGSYLAARDSMNGVESYDGLNVVAPGETNFPFLGESPNGLVALKKIAINTKSADPSARRPFAVAEQNVARFDALEHSDAVPASPRLGCREPGDTELPCLSLRPRLKREDVCPKGHGGSIVFRLLARVEGHLPAARN